MRQLEREPEAPLDDAEFPKISVGSDIVTYAPGAVDAVFGGGGRSEGDSRSVETIIREANAGEVRDWRSLEHRLTGISALSAVDEVLKNLEGSCITYSTARLFRELARNSRSYEVVKWGIAIGSFGAGADYIPELLQFARHAEFALYAGVALLRMSPKHPEVETKVLELLPVSQQWGVIRLIELLLARPALATNPVVQREILVSGMENSEGIPMEIAFTIAEGIDLRYFCAQSDRDARVYSAVSALMETLFTEPNPLGGIENLPNAEEVFDEYITMLQRHPPDLRVLTGVRAAQRFLRSDRCKWPSREERLARVVRLAEETFSEAIVREGLSDPSTRWDALELIREMRLTTLLPEVEALFDKRADAATIAVLSELGDTRHLQLMFDRIPELVNLAERAKRSMSRVNVFGPEHQNNYEYAQIVKALGGLATPEAILHLKGAARDYDPCVRSAACEAFRHLRREQIDDEIIAVIQERLLDSPEYVAQSAQQAARLAGLPLLRDSEEGTQKDKKQ